MSHQNQNPARVLRLKFLIQVILLALLATATTARAEFDEDDEIFSRRGGTMMFSGLVAFESFSDTGTSKPKDLQSGGLQVRYGYRFDPLLAGELQFEWADGWTQKDKITGAVTGDVDHVVTGSANLKVYLLQNVYQPYLLVGLGATHIRQVDTANNKHSVSQFSVRTGAGIDLYLAESVGLNVEYTFVQPTQNLSDFHYHALGLGFFLRF